MLYSRNYVAFGVPLRLLVGSLELLSELPSLLPHSSAILPGDVEEAQTFSLLPPSGAYGYRSYIGSELTMESADAQPVLHQFARDLIVHVANLAPEHVFVHAGVVSWRGNGIVLPGTSFAGKTTLTAALVRAGATYYSDEYAVVDASGRVHPYARDLQMREEGSPEQRSIAVAHLDGATGTAPIRVGHVIFARYAKGAAWNLQPVSRGMAALEMLRHAIPVQRTPARVMSTLAAMLEGATAWSSERGEADATAAMLLESLAAEEFPGAKPPRVEEGLPAA